MFISRPMSRFKSVVEVFDKMSLLESRNEHEGRQDTR